MYKLKVKKIYIYKKRKYKYHFVYYPKVKKEFLMLVADGDGNISISELEVLLMSIKSKLKMTSTEISKLLKSYDADGDGHIDTREFLSMITTGEKRSVIRKALVQRHGVREAFKKYDKDNSGFITRDEFRKVVEDKYQARLRTDQVDQMMANVDKNEDGKIDYEEFYKAFRYFPVTK